MKSFLFFFSFLFFQSLLFSQNLLPNGSFELTTNLDYTNPASSFDYLDFWYPASQHTSDPFELGTPDFFDFNNQWPLSDPRTFWNNAVKPYEGSRHAGLANFAGLEGYFAPESICSSINAPLEAGAYYHIEFQIRNKGTDGFDNTPIFCLVEDRFLFSV